MKLWEKRVIKSRLDLWVVTTINSTARLLCVKVGPNFYLKNSERPLVSNIETAVKL